MKETTKPQPLPTKNDRLRAIFGAVLQDIFNPRPPKAVVKNPAGYPETVAEVLDDNMVYRPSTLAAMRRFRRSQPWHGGRKAQEMKIRRLCRDLATSYNIERPTVTFLREFAAGACYWPVGNLIIMERENDGRYSIVTFLHEFGHALGKNEVQTCRWSINLFRKFFPKSYAKLVPEGHILKRVVTEEKPTNKVAQ